jgi:hypothetical protein
VALAMNPPMQVSSSSSLMSLATTYSQERAPRESYNWERKLWFLGFSALLLGNCRPHSNNSDRRHLALLVKQNVHGATGAKGITVEGRVEPEITNSTCFASPSAVRQDHPDAWPSWTLRALGHEGTKCWYPTTRTLAHDHPK